MALNVFVIGEDFQAFFEKIIKGNPTVKVFIIDINKVHDFVLSLQNSTVMKGLRPLLATSADFQFIEHRSHLFEFSFEVSIDYLRTILFDFGLDLQLANTSKFPILVHLSKT